MKRIVKLLILSDFFIFSGFGLVAPIIAIFIKENLINGSTEAAGIASMIFILTKSILQPLIAYIAEPHHRKQLLIGGTFLIFIIPIIYFFSTHVWHIYLASAMYGLGAAVSYPAWLSLFISNLTKGAEGFEWSVYSTIGGLGSALAAYVGASLAEKMGFSVVFVVVGIMVFLGFITLLFISFKEKSLKKAKVKKIKNK